MKRKYSKAEREHFAKITRRFIEEDAYRALSSHAKALYVVLKFEWKGPRANNNGCITFSVRQAAEALGISPDTAAKAFYDLQAKGFIVVTEIGHPGVWGLAKGNQYETHRAPAARTARGPASLPHLEARPRLRRPEGQRPQPEGLQRHHPKTRTGFGGSGDLKHRTKPREATELSGQPTSKT